MALLKRSKPEGKADPEGRMPLMEHLRELRNRLVIGMLGVTAGTVVGFVFFDTLWQFVSSPYCNLPFAQSLKAGTCFQVRAVFEAFFVNLKVAIVFGMVVSAPLWLYQIWAFVTPGLYRNERRYTSIFLAIGVPLFAAGTALAYFVLDKGLALLFSFAPDNATPFMEMTSYIDYALLMFIVFGVSFELPLLLVLLNVIGVLKRATVAKHRRMIIFAMFVFGAIATPGSDPIAMIALSIPLVIFFALAELFMYWRESRLPKTEDYSHLSDDEASELSDDDPRDRETSGPSASGR
ncbi:twin-arginine translocase subunit TatC [Sinosporangium siamense]|uniref:Sec-independent protein translocase protein TatC n=1 Tax=Sinosporangium siamense TaxID=1367973 RepID=A0A919RHD3_9ACTN|nr:twin-arginine translocase subunit TatC [Sinosporangium siamense]GII93910.1 Sec-independent protein translocase protein TatC [Sinosporangium siamense]